MSDDVALISLVQAGVKQTPPERRGQQPSLEVGLGLGSYPVPSSAHRPRTGSENHGDPGPSGCGNCGPHLPLPARRPPARLAAERRASHSRPASDAPAARRRSGPGKPGHVTVPTGGAVPNGGPGFDYYSAKPAAAGEARAQGAPRPYSLRASNERLAQRHLAAQFTGRLSFRRRAARPPRTRFSRRACLPRLRPGAPGRRRAHRDPSHFARRVSAPAA